MLEKSITEKEKKWKIEKDAIHKTYKEKNSKLESEIRNLKRENKEQSLRIQNLMNTRLKK